jgi:NAD(P)-dependent dehydrogenase (short-subunit alcohol dehydrogenase family)
VTERGPVLIVTGGSRGIGAAVCRLAAARGWTVVINYRSDGEAARAVLAEVEAAGGAGAAIPGDVAEEADVAHLFDAAAELGPVTGLVANAGIVGAAGRLDEQSMDTVRRVIEVNVLGVILCAREAVRRMSTRYGGSGGSVVTVSSTAAGRGSPGEWVHYAASKAAVESLSHGLAIEVGDEGVRVNAVAPGLVETGLHAAAGMPDRTVTRAPMIPMKRAGRPEEIAEGILWLLSPAASFVTGAVLPISGGY